MIMELKPECVDLTPVFVTVGDIIIQWKWNESYDFNWIFLIFFLITSKEQIKNLRF